MADSIFNVTQIIGKTLVANTVVNMRRFPDVKGQITGKTKPGNVVGIVYSYVNRGGKIWWQIGDERGSWVQHNPGWFSVRALKNQGALTQKEETLAKEKSEETFGDKLSNFFGPTTGVMKYALPIGLLFVGFVVADRFLPAKK